MTTSSSAGSAFLIKLLSPGDLADMAALLDIFGEAFGEPDLYAGRRPDGGYARRLLARGHVIALVALRGDVVVGGLVAYELKKFEQDRSEIYLCDLAVVEAHRRQVAATALIEHLCRLARARGAWVVFIRADVGDEAAIALYSKLGVREDVLHFDLAPAGGRCGE